MSLTRRALFPLLITAPAIVRYSSIMPVKVLPPIDDIWAQKTADQIMADIQFGFEMLLKQSQHEIIGYSARGLALTKEKGPGG